MPNAKDDTLGESRAEPIGPCDGIRVLDFTTVVSGPVCTQTLGDLGADVIKVEPILGDFSRLSGGTPHAGLNGFFAQNNRNKRSIVIDLKSEKGLGVALDLAKRADVVVENYRPGVADRIGIGWDTLRAANERLVYVAISGFGPTGPYASQPAYDHLIQGLTGFMPVQGNREEPNMVQSVIGDKVGGLTAATGVLAALFERERSGRGQRIDVPMLDAYASFILTDELGPRTFAELPPQPNIGTSIFRSFATRDGHVVGIAAQDDQFRALCRALEREDLIEDDRFSTIGVRFANSEAFNQVIETELVKWPTQVFISRAREMGAPFAPVLDVDGFLADEQVQHNESVVTRHVAGAGATRFLRPPLRFGRTPASIRLDPPRLGEQTDEILEEIGYSESQREDLRKSKAIR